MPVTSAFVFVPASVRLQYVISRLANIGLSARAVSTHVNGKNKVDEMINARAELVAWLRSGTQASPHSLVATTDSV